MTACISIDVQVASVVASVPDDQEIQSWIGEVLRELDFERNCEVSVRIVDEDEGRDLNKRYRDIDRATNVLSFPSGNEAYGHWSSDVPYPLGDIVLCGPVVEREAAEQHKELSAHWAHLLVHGTLHLLGHDHELDADAAAMEELEIRILRRRDLADPYLVQA